jgi:energy-coupling factor transporter ATP-binding protein EcfA2
MEEVVALQQKVLDIHEREGFINTHKEELSEAASERDEAYGAADTRILQNLWYPEMTYRHKEIEEAHRKTFAWILKHNPDTLLCAKPGCQGRAWHNFTKWLKEPGELYWINGKAGSGKSTLVRYICDNTTTRKYLESWAGVLKHQMISFYFWSSGSNEQCSQIGLLRSLLHQILKVRPALIRIVFEEEWDNLVLSQNSSKFTGRVWSFSQLEHAIYEALRLIENESMMSVFIDGLDEFEGNPEEVERLVGLVKTISGFPNVKVCLSSRPWRVFEEHFEGYPGLRLQDLTYEDIRLYVQDRVGENGKMLRLARSQPPQAAVWCTKL